MSVNQDSSPGMAKTSIIRPEERQPPLVQLFGPKLGKFMTCIFGIIDTNVLDMEQGFQSGGEIKASKHIANYRGQIDVPLIKLDNDAISCIYTVSTVMGINRRELRESLDIIRKDMEGGTIFYFTDGKITHGITNAVTRFMFSPEEIETAGRIRKQVREIAKRTMK